MKTKLNTKTIVAAVASVIGLAVYGYTSMVGYLAASATSTLPVVLTVAALVCLALRQFAGSKLPAVVNDVLLVADEVICGFGRTGEWFAADYFGFTPDVMTLAKGITSGYIPLGAAMFNDRVAGVLATIGAHAAHAQTAADTAVELGVGEIALGVVEAEVQHLA